MRLYYALALAFLASAAVVSIGAAAEAGSERSLLAPRISGPPLRLLGGTSFRQVSSDDRYLVLDRDATNVDHDRVYDSRRARFAEPLSSGCYTASGRYTARVIRCGATEIPLVLSLRTRRRYDIPAIRPGDYLSIAGNHWVEGARASEGDEGDAAVYINWRVGRRVTCIGLRCRDNRGRRFRAPSLNPDLNSPRFTADRDLLRLDRPNVVSVDGPRTLLQRYDPRLRDTRLFVRHPGHRTRTLSRACPLCRTSMRGARVAWSKPDRGVISASARDLRTGRSASWRFRIAGFRPHAYTVRPLLTRYRIFFLVAATASDSEEGPVRVYAARWPGR